MASKNDPKSRNKNKTQTFEKKVREKKPEILIEKGIPNFEDKIAGKEIIKEVAKFGKKYVLVKNV